MTRELWEELGIDSLFYEQMVNPAFGEDPEYRELVKQAYVARGELSSSEASLETMHEGEARVQWWVDQLEAGSVDPDHLLGEMLAQAQEGGDGLSTDPQVVEFREDMADHLQEVIEEEGDRTGLLSTAWDFRWEEYPVQEVALPDYEPGMVDEDPEAWSLFTEWYRSRWQELDELGAEDAGFVTADVDFEGTLEELAAADPEPDYEGVSATRLGFFDEGDWFLHEDGWGEEEWSLHVTRGHDGFAAGDVIELTRDDGESIEVVSEGGGAQELASAFNDVFEQEAAEDPDASDDGAWAWTGEADELTIEFIPDDGEWSLDLTQFEALRLETAGGELYELTELPAASLPEVHAETFDAWRDELAEAGWPESPQEVQGNPWLPPPDEGGL